MYLIGWYSHVDDTSVQNGKEIRLVYPLAKLGKVRILNTVILI